MYLPLCQKLVVQALPDLLTLKFSMVYLVINHKYNNRYIIEQIIPNQNKILYTYFIPSLPNGIFNINLLRVILCSNISIGKNKIIPKMASPHTPQFFSIYMQALPWIL